MGSRIVQLLMRHMGFVQSEVQPCARQWTQLLLSTKACLSHAPCTCSTCACTKHPEAETLHMPCANAVRPSAGAARARAAPDSVRIGDGRPERPARALGRVVRPAVCHSVRSLGKGAAAPRVAARCLLRRIGKREQCQVLLSLMCGVCWAWVCSAACRCLWMRQQYALRAVSPCRLTKSLMCDRGIPGSIVIQQMQCRSA